jgi:hypothetical protein
MSGKLSALQDIMYAHNHYAVLILSSGHGHIWKDSLIQEFLGNSARGVVVHSLKLPIRQSWNTIICGVTILHYLKREVCILTDHITKMFCGDSASEYTLCEFAGN